MFLCPPEPPKLLLSTFLLAYLSLFSVLPSCARLHSRNYGNGTEVVTGVEVG